MIYREKHSQLPRYAKLATFSSMMFQKSSALISVKDNYDDMWEEFLNYREAIPSIGAALLSKDFKKILLVQAYRGKSWGFPRGKINEGESYFDCACREVYEETSFDIKKHIETVELNITENDWLSHKTKKGKLVRILVIPEVPIEFNFVPIVRKEIGAVKWFDINKLPRPNGVNQNSNFWQICQFFIPLKSWIKIRKKRQYIQSSRKGSPIDETKRKIKSESPADIKFLDIPKILATFRLALNAPIK